MSGSEPVVLRLRRVLAALLSVLAFTLVGVYESPADAAQPVGSVSVFSGPGISDPYELVMGPDGAVWFTNQGSNSIGRVTPDGTVANFADPGISAPRGITVGPDGALWFGAVGTVGRITTSGEISLFAGVGAADVATGPDGTLWLAMGASVGRFTTAGQVDVHATPMLSGGPQTITAGADGALWMGTRSPANLVRTTTDWQFSVYGPKLVEDLVSGPDGALWLARSYGVEKFLTSGVSDGTASTSTPLVNSVAVGPDGMAWFLQHESSAKALRVASDVSVTEFPAVGAWAHGVAGGSDGGVWFGDQGDDTVRRIEVVSGPPGAPSGVSGTAGNGAVFVSWAAPALVGGSSITGYTVTASPGGGSCSRSVGPTGALPGTGGLGCTVSGLDNGTAYAFSVSATNGSGDGPASGPSPLVTPTAGLPTEPVGVGVVAGGGQAVVSWQPPANDGGSMVSGYTATAQPGGKFCTWVSGPLSCTISGLDDGNVYSVVVTAGNGNGSGLAGGVVQARPSTTPLAPVFVKASAGKASAVVSWSAPLDRGAPIGGYTVTADPGGQQCTTTGAHHCTVPGLTPGQSYTFTVTATNTNGTSEPSAVSNTVVPWQGSGFGVQSPTRVLDSRDGTGWAGPLDAGAPRDLQVTGSAGAPVGATAVVLNVAVTGSSAPSYLSAWPTGQSQPTTANLNMAAGETISNQVTVKIGDGGKVSFATAAGATHVVADVVGWFDDGTPTDGLRYTPRAPLRTLDSRTGTGGWASTPLVAGTPRDLTVLGAAGVPPTAKAVVANVTVTGSTAGSVLTTWPAWQPQPTAANLNFAAGQTISNLVVLPVGAGGKASFATAVGSTNVIVDVVGWYDPTAGNRFYPLDPTRILDDRNGTGLTGPWGPNTTRTLPVAGSNNVPVDATAIIANITATNATDGSYLTTFPTGVTKPTAANLLFGPGQTIPNLTITALGTNGATDLSNQLGTVDVIADLAGYFGPV